MKTKKDANASQVEQGDGGDGGHVENPLLSEVEGSRGAKLLSEAVGCGRHRIHLILHIIHSLLIMYTR